ncbi:hypothetical protein CYMTET_37177 [Cymbomonas tetramitiformis]|uniref:Glycosyltransferase 2-like domain-containing protein n=1 Tax=Cymbomonas tetramitiformis TaxID=36881 RepID=A0AAE0CGT7_9CHLO|nr:hypothetical protein CYMTET_37177 [Cymbomonas tetramitiformis]
MHSEIFNENGVHTYYKELLQDGKWDYEARDVFPERFLQEMFEGYRKLPGRFKTPSQCKAVGFKSFPNHYLENGEPSALLQDIYSKFMSDPSMKKIVLMRENVIAVHVSAIRSYTTGMYMTSNYDHIPVTVDVARLQQFVDATRDTYQAYRERLQEQRACFIRYEDLVADRGGTMVKILRYLGVNYDVIPEALEECIPQSSSNTNGLVQAIQNYSEVEFAYRHTALAVFLPRDPTPSFGGIELNDHTRDVGVEAATFCSEKRFPRAGAGRFTERWSLLIPVCQGHSSRAACLERLREFHRSLLKTTTIQDRQRMTLVFGVDKGDPLYDCDYQGQVLRDIFVDLNVVVKVLVGLKGKICHIWRELAKCAFEHHNADYTVLLGDDIVLQSVDWTTRVEESFGTIADECRLPFGAACVAFNDTSFIGFPTFPVIHKWHFETFGDILPSQLQNQGGDPFLFELYKRFGAARFELDARLENSLGGQFPSARYRKDRVRFENDILTQWLSRLHKALLPSCPKRVPCLDVVVPTFRCDLAQLRRITALRASVPVAVSFWIIQDNPDSPLRQQIKNMQQVSQNYQVNVREHATNRGASAARNYGLGHSYADWVVLIDDDVVPTPHLLDAYLGAIARFPSASVLVGTTHLPAPMNLLTSAIVASDIPGAYTIAERRANPPWGVTANLCVRGRTSRLRFQLQYPKTGGGEDLDFCIRARRHGPIKAVPGARADHPWWSNGEVGAIRHILGWAEGESLCVGSSLLREHVFWTLPNGVELCLVLFALMFVAVPGGVYSMQSAVCMQVIILLMETLWHGNRLRHRVKGVMKATFLMQGCVIVCGAWLIMMQESARFIAHLRQGAWSNLCWRFDWHCGQAPRWVAKSKCAHACRFFTYLVLCMCTLL